MRGIEMTKYLDEIPSCIDIVQRVKLRAILKFTIIQDLLQKRLYIQL